jgi:hypothetical protein
MCDLFSNRSEAILWVLSMMIWFPKTRACTIPPFGNAGVELLFRDACTAPPTVSGTPFSVGQPWLFHWDVVQILGKKTRRRSGREWHIRSPSSQKDSGEESDGQQCENGEDVIHVDNCVKGRRKLEERGLLARSPESQCVSNTDTSSVLDSPLYVRGRRVKLVGCLVGVRPARSVMPLWQRGLAS